MEKVKKFIVDSCLQAKEKGLKVENGLWGVVYSKEEGKWTLENSADEINKLGDTVCPLGAVLLAHGHNEVLHDSGTPDHEYTVLKLLMSKFPEEMKGTHQGNISQFVEVIDEGVREDSTLVFEQLALNVSKDIDFNIKIDESVDEEDDEEGDCDY
jgi:hypothetical protein